MRYCLALLPLFALAACGSANSEMRDNGPSVSRAFSVGAFTAVSLDGPDDVRVVRGPAVRVDASGTQTVLDNLTIRVEGSTLKIGRKASVSQLLNSGDRGAQIMVVVPNISAAAITGSGDMSIDRVDSDGLDAAVSGSGNIKLPAIAVKRFKLAIAGSGAAQLAGSSQTADFSVSGSGDIDATGLASRQATISARGSGDIRAAASDSAAISIAGSGDVSVTGTQNCTISTAGSGNARCTR